MNQTLYNTDFYAWTRQQAALLQAEEFEELDLPNLIEELESMGNSQRTEVISRLTVLLMHLLKWQFQPEYQSRSWANTIRVQRLDLEEVLEDNPSLRREVPTLFAKAYTRASRKALAEIGLLRAPWPNTCPWTAEQILDEEWLPEAEAK
jgi:hypothetical protein